MAARRVPDQPTIYVCAEDRGDAGLAPDAKRDGAERLLVLINAPPTGDTRPQSLEETRQCAETTFARLRQMGGTPLGGTPDQAAAFLRDEIERWAKVVKESGARAD